MSRLRLLRVARRHPVAVGAVAGVIAVQVIWMAEAACPPMAITDCLVAAIVLVAAASALAVAVRASWLVAATARELAALPRASAPPSLVAAAQRAGITRLRCLAGKDRTAFCAGFLRPRGYLTTATATLGANELAAILATKPHTPGVEIRCGGGSPEPPPMWCPPWPVPPKPESPTSSVRICR